MKTKYTPSRNTRLALARALHTETQGAVTWNEAQHLVARWIDETKTLAKCAHIVKGYVYDMIGHITYDRAHYNR